MEISYIALTRTETKILKKSAKTPIPKNSCARLLRLDLVEEIMEYSHGDMPIETGLCEITDIGTDFLAYRKQFKKDILLENAWIPVVVSILTNLLTDGIQWLLPLIQQLFSNAVQ